MEETSQLPTASKKKTTHTYIFSSLLLGIPERNNGFAIQDASLMRRKGDSLKILNKKRVERKRDVWESEADISEFE